MAHAPLVTIGVPVYNGAASLRRSIESALAQDWPALEVVVSDNGSTDGTSEILAALVALHANVRFERQATNRGPVFNFNRVLAMARGEYFMWLAADDWIDPGYVAACVESVRQPGHALACGRVEYERSDGSRFEGQRVDVEDDDAAARVAAYYRVVSDNATFYGLARTEDWRRARMRGVPGTDWLMVASLAFVGKVRTLPSTTLHRQFAWEPVAGLERLARFYGRSLPTPSRLYFWIGAGAARDVLGNPIYRTLPVQRRARLAAEAARIVWQRHAVLGSESARFARALLPDSWWRRLASARGWPDG